MAAVEETMLALLGERPRSESKLPAGSLRSMVRDGGRPLTPGTSSGDLSSSLCSYTR